MTDISLQDQELIRRYLAGQLIEEENRMVEARIVRDARFRHELELTASLRDGMRELESRGEIDGFLIGARTGWQHPSIAVAASIGALVIASLSIFYFVEDSRSPQSPITTASLQFERTRGVSPDDLVRWKIRAAPTRLRLSFDVGATPAVRYRVVIFRGTAESTKPVVDSVEDTSAEGAVFLTLEDSLLTPGDFEIRLTPISESADAEAIVYYLAVTDG